MSNVPQWHHADSYSCEHTRYSSNTLYVHLHMAWQWSPIPSEGDSKRHYNSSRSRLFPSANNRQAISNDVGWCHRVTNDWLYTSSMKGSWYCATTQWTVPDCHGRSCRHLQIPNVIIHNLMTASHMISLLLYRPHTAGHPNIILWSMDSRLNVCI